MAEAGAAARSKHDHQRPNGQANHGDAAENGRRDRHECGHRNGRRQNRALIAAQQGKRNALQEARLGNHGHEKCQAQNEEHRIGVDQVVQAPEGQ